MRYGSHPLPWQLINSYNHVRYQLPFFINSMSITRLIPHSTPYYNQSAVMAVSPPTVSASPCPGSSASASQFLWPVQHLGNLLRCSLPGEAPCKSGALYWRRICIVTRSSCRVPIFELVPINLDCAGLFGSSLENQLPREQAYVNVKKTMSSLAFPLAQPFIFSGLGWYKRAGFK